MAKNTKNRNVQKSQKAYYVLAFGVIVLLAGLVAAFSHQVVAGFTVIVVGVFVSAVGLSMHSLRLLKTSAAPKA